MKKIAYILTGLVCSVLCTLSVKADLIWEPEDSFYQKHASECTYVNRQFTADGPDGIVILYKSPEVADVEGTWENGFTVRISHTYKGSDGIVWGINEDYGEACGWVPMDYMKLVYDNISFEEEYREEIADRKGTLEGKSKGDSVKFWAYPGFEKGGTEVELLDKPPEYSGVYVDEQGHSWGKIGYYYGRRNCWICIDKPDADYEELYPNGGPAIGKDTDRVEDGIGYKDGTGSAARDTERIVPKGGGRAVATAAVMVALVVAVSAILLIILRRGRRK